MICRLLILFACVGLSSAHSHHTACAKCEACAIAYEEQEPGAEDSLGAIAGGDVEGGVASLAEFEGDLEEDQNVELEAAAKYGEDNLDEVVALVADMTTQADAAVADGFDLEAHVATDLQSAYGVQQTVDLCTHNCELCHSMPGFENPITTDPMAAVFEMKQTASASSTSAASTKKGAVEQTVPLTEQGQKVIWAGFFGLAVPAAYFWMQTLSAPESSNRKYHVYTTMICTIAALAYLTMATGNGVYVREFDGREFFYARYIDWTLTTPLMLIDILGLAGATSDTTNMLIGADILMIISGLIGAFLEGQEKYYFWGFGMVMFIPILYYLNALKGPSGTTLSKISLLTIVGWSAYPIVWLVAEGQGTITGDQEAMAYTVLDFLCKSAFGYIIISARDVATPLGGDNI